MYSILPTEKKKKEIILYCPRNDASFVLNCLSGIIIRVLASSVVAVISLIFFTYFPEGQIKKFFLFI